MGYFPEELRALPDGQLGLWCQFLQELTHWLGCRNPEPDALSSLAGTGFELLDTKLQTKISRAYDVELESSDLDASWNAFFLKSIVVLRHVFSKHFPSEPKPLSEDLLPRLRDQVVERVRKAAIGEFEVRRGLVMGILGSCGLQVPQAEISRLLPEMALMCWILSTCEAPETAPFMDDLKSIRAMLPVDPVKKVPPKSGAVPRSGFVYFAQAQDTKAIKIGYSRNVQGRLKSLQTSNASTLVLLGCIVGPPELEKQWHLKLKHAQLRSEWFAPKPGVLKEIQAAIADAAPEV